MDDCLSDMSTGTLALAKNRRTRLDTHPLDERISLTDGNVFVVVQNPQISDLRELKKKT